MRYFFLAYAMIALVVVGILGFRGQKFEQPPVRIFPDMDEQDKLRAQKPSGFFADGQGARLPVAGTQARGFNPHGDRELGGIPEYEFGGQGGYYYTGHSGDYYGKGMPAELELTSAEAAESLIRRGQERYGIYCAICHGESGNGKGVVTEYGVPVVGNPNAVLNSISSEAYPDGRLFEVITMGKGLMGGYGANIPVRDRWAIIAYIHTLQAAKKAASE